MNSSISAYRGLFQFQVVVVLSGVSMLTSCDRCQSNPRTQEVTWFAAMYAQFCWSIIANYLSARYSRGGGSVACFCRAHA